jgi:hypothetical protein
MYQYILGMYWYEHFRRVSSMVSGFQMLAGDNRRPVTSTSRRRLAAGAGDERGPATSEFLTRNWVARNLKKNKQ